MRRQPSIRRKLSLVFWGAALLAFAAASGGLALYQHVTLERRARAFMAPYARLVSVGSVGAVAFEDADRAQEILEPLKASPQIVRAAIVLEDGRILASLGAPRPGAAGRSSRSTDGVYVAADGVELVQALPRGARLHLVMDPAALRADERQAFWVLGAGGLVLVALALAQLLILQRTIVSPLAALTEATELVRTGADRANRVPAAGEDEVGRLGRSFNAMMAAVEERERELRQMALFQRTLVHGAPYAIVSATVDGVVTSLNPAAERLLGYSAAELVGAKTPVAWHDPGELERRARQLTAELGEPIAPGFEVFAAPARRGAVDEREWTFVRKDGGRVPVLLSVAALRGADGTLAGFIGIASDLTERKRAEEEVRTLNRELERRVADRTAQLEVANAQLEAANKELESFAYSVSHDLRAPLRHIDGYMQLLVRGLGEGLNARNRHYMDTIGDASRRMGRLIDDLLAFSRMGRQQMTWPRVDLGGLVREAIRELEPEVKGRTVRWRIAPLPEVNGDPAMLRLVLANLLSNAVKFTRRRETAEIEVGVGEPSTSGEVVVVVRDNGVGFDPRYADRLFGVFQRLHRAEEFDGTGIGLATVRRIVARHGGRVWAESAPDQGAAFYFSLPRAGACISVTDA